MDAPVRVTVVGSGNAFGDGGRMQACLHVRAARSGTAMLIDCGATALVGLKRLGLEPNDISVIAISHLHGDHFGGLPFAILDGQFRRRTRPLRLVGPPGLESRLERAMEVFFPGSTSVTRRFATEVHEVAPGSTVEVGGCAVHAVEADHSAGAVALALRVAVGGRTIAYSGDSAWTDGLINIADGADLFVCEAYTFDRPVRYHLHLPELIARLDRLRGTRVLLTHPGPQVLERRAELELELAEDGLAVDV